MMSAAVAAGYQTRDSLSIWLLGEMIPALEGNQLPTNRQVLCRLFFDLKINKLDVPRSCSNVIDDVLQFWHMANIPTKHKPNAIAKLKAFYQEYVLLRKNKARRTERQGQLETDFSHKLNQLFDLSHANSEQLIKIPQDFEFLQDQQGPRKMIMTGEDLQFKKREEKRQKRQGEEMMRIEKEQEAKKQMVMNPNEVLDDSSQSTGEESANDDEPVEINKYFSKQIDTPETSGATTPMTMKLDKRCIVEDPLAAASLDRTGTTPREAMHIIGPALKAAGVPVSRLTLSTTSLYEARRTVRKSIGETIQENFSPDTPLVVHFDGKLMPDNDGTMADRLPVVVSGKDVEKLLGIPKLQSGTGILMGEAVIKFINEWDGVSEWLAGLCFDTTSTNTGLHMGAITIIQNALNKRLLFLACRHHIFEIIASAVFDTFFVASGPQIGIFGRFKKHWTSIDTSKFASLATSLDGSEKVWFENNRDSAITFLRSQLMDKQPRDDYLEFIRLALITLGDNVEGHVKFSPPGAYHRARWMAKGIYCLKISCFRDQFQLSAHEFQSLRCICLFTVTLYVKAWFTANDTCNAPSNDLHLLQAMEDYSEVNQKVAKTALSKLRSHLWYLSEDLVGLVLFSDKIAVEVKKDVVISLEKPEMKEDVRRVHVPASHAFKGRQLAEFVTRRSLNLFCALKLSKEFLKSDPETWSSNQDYILAQEKVSALRVVNDCAERAIKLATDFNLALTHDEEQRQLIFQVVEQHRKLIRKPLKKHFFEDNTT